MKMSCYAVVSFCSVSLSLAGITWKVSESDEAQKRRLATILTSSTTNYADPGCIVGGFDDQNPGKVYVGGPCSELDLTTQNGAITSVTPKAGFRFMSMEVHNGGFSDKAGNAWPMIHLQGSNFMTHGDYASHSEVGTTGSAFIAGSYAGITMGQKSYLSKKSFGFKANSFPYYRDSQGNVHNMEACVTPCCTGHGCQCPSGEAANSCSGAEIAAEEGQYKFSVFAAAGDGGFGDANYKEGADGNGWEALKNQYGIQQGQDKQLSGDLFVDQIIDFTGMQADSVTVHGPGNSKTLYKDMKDFTGDEVYQVESFTVSGGGWTGKFGFRKTYNGGLWTMDDQFQVSTQHMVAGHVKIYCGKLSNQKLVDMKIAADLTAAAAMKIVFLRYVFDATGITGAQTRGIWMAYDPTITTDTGSTSGASGMPRILAVAIAFVIFMFQYL